MTQDWQEFFDNFAPKYMDECFTKNTEAEIDFLLEELKLPAGGSILDIGCGTGRHTVGLASRGFRVTGVDLSSGMLGEAQQAADAAGVSVELVHCDATKFQSEPRFDAAICLCEGAFGLLGAKDDPIDHDLAILRAVHGALKPGGNFLMNALNACRSIRKATAKDLEAGIFDPMTMIEVEELPLEDVALKGKILGRQRMYVPTELAILLRWAGFEVKNIWGGTAGAWGRRPLDLDEMEIMVVAAKGK